MWHISYGNPSKKQILLRTFGTHRSTSSPINARRSNIWAEGRPTRPGEGVPGRTPKSKKKQNRRKSCSIVLNNSKISWFFNFSLRGDSRRPPTAIRQPPGIPPKNPPRSPSWARKWLIRPWRIVAFIRVCVGEFPQHTFRECQRAGTSDN